MRPLIYFVPAFILGLLVSRAAEPSYSLVVVLLLISLALLTSATIKGGKVRVVLACPAFFVVGLLYLLPCLTLYDSPQNIRNLIKADSASVRMEGVVIGAVEPRGNGVRFYLDLTGVSIGAQWQRADGLVQINMNERGASLEGIGRGDTVRVFARLKRPRNFGNPGGFDYEWWLRGRGVSMTAYARAPLIIKIDEAAPSLLGILDLYRSELGAFIGSAGLSHAGILKALTIGYKGDIAQSEREAFRGSGTAHLLAISGLHIGFVAFISYLALFWLFRRSHRLMLAIDVRRTAIIASFLPVFFYGALSGFSLSTQRAVIMIGAYVVTIAICRVKDLYSTLALAALVVLLINPAALWDVGFQLSFTAVLAIIYVMMKSREVGDLNLTKNWVRIFWWRFVLRLRDFTLITVAASLATAPLIAFYFHRIFAVGFLANFIIVPITTFLVVPISLLAVVVYAVSPNHSLWFMRLADFMIGIIVIAAERFAGLDWAFSWVSMPSFLEMAAFYIVLASLPLFFIKHSRRRAVVIAAIGLVVLFGHAGYIKFAAANAAELKITFISVGQGDAALVEFPADKAGRRVTMLIDGGGFSSVTFDSGKDIIAPFLWYQKIRQVDYLVLSHPQRDHMKGLGFIAENFGPREVWWGGAGRISERLSSILKENEVKVLELGAQTPAKIIDGVRVEFLGPPKSVDLDINDSSLVMRLEYGKRRILFTGDIAEAGEASLMRSYDVDALRADVMKAPHHGSRYSSADEFIRRVAPQAVVISAGHENSFGFPHAETLERYRRREADIYRTDRGGAIVVTTDGIAMDVRSHLTER